MAQQIGPSVAELLPNAEKAGWLEKLGKAGNEEANKSSIGLSSASNSSGSLNNLPQQIQQQQQTASNAAGGNSTTLTRRRTNRVSAAASAIFGSRGRNKWKKRFFIVNGRLLYYYKTDAEKMPKLVVKLQDYHSITHDPDAYAGRPNSFRLISMHHLPTLTLSADSAEGMKEWMELLKSKLSTPIDEERRTQEWLDRQQRRMSAEGASSNANTNSNSSPETLPKKKSRLNIFDTLRNRRSTSNNSGQQSSSAPVANTNSPSGNEEEEEEVVRTEVQQQDTVRYSTPGPLSIKDDTVNDDSNNGDDELNSEDALNETNNKDETIMDDEAKQQDNKDSVTHNNNSSSCKWTTVVVIASLLVIGTFLAATSDWTREEILQFLKENTPKVFQ